jgi:hypothetical protein
MRKRIRTKSRFEKHSEDKELLKKIIIGGAAVFVFMGMFTIKEALFPEKKTVTYSSASSSPEATLPITTYSPTITTTIRSQSNETTSKTLGQTKTPIRPSVTRNLEKQRSRYVLDGG